MNNGGQKYACTDGKTAMARGVRDLKVRMDGVYVYEKTAMCI